MNAFLLDTCIWLDYHLPEREGHSAAFKLVSAAHKNSYPLLIASHSLKDFWYIFWQIGKRLNMAAGNLSPENASKVAKTAAWATTENIASNVTVVGSDSSDSRLALKMRAAHDDYEDNLVVAAALRAKPQYLVDRSSLDSPLPCGMRYSCRCTRISRLALRGSPMVELQVKSSIPDRPWW